MKPTSEQTRNAILSAVPFLATTEPVHVVTAPHPTTVDPTLAYGCVDWYMYPDSKVENVAA